MSDYARKGILPPPSPEAEKRGSLDSYRDDEEPNSIGPTTSIIPPPPPPAPLRPSMSAGQRLSSLLPPGARLSIQSMLPVARKSIQSMLPVWKPRWRPWSPSRALGAIATFALAFGIFMYAAYPRLVKYAQRFQMPGFHLRLAAATLPEPVVVPAEEPTEKAEADKNLKRDGRSPVAGGVLSIPASFRSDDGAYDLVLFFHGNTSLVEEAMSTAKVNAIVLIFNLGIGSGVYEDKFAVPGLVPEILDRVKTTLGQRGLANAHMRRLGLGAWSAGYGAVEKILEQRPLEDKIDAVFLLDGIHVGFMQDGKSLDMLRLHAFSDYAKKAVAGDKFFYITHSNIIPPNYAGTRETTDAVLKEVGVTREKLTDIPVMPVMNSLVGVVAKDKIKPLTPVSQAHKGLLNVYGYTGETPEDHMAHLMQMSETALPALVEYWSKTAKK
jgi:hypothetical protein